MIEPAAGRRPRRADLPARRLRRGRGAGRQGQAGEAHRAAAGPRLAPVKVAVLPLSRNADLSPKARDLAATLRKRWNCDFDDASAIGRRYRRQDEIGTPFCVTVDFDTLEDQAVTVRDRDTMKQERVGIDALEGYLSRAPRPLLTYRPVDLGRGLVESRRASPAAAMVAAISSISATQRQPLAAADPAAAADRRSRPGWEMPHSSSSVRLDALGPGQRPRRQQQRGRSLGPRRVGHLHRRRRARRRRHPRVHVGAAEQRLYLRGARPGQVQPGAARRRRRRPDDPAVHVAGRRLGDRRDLPRRRPARSRWRPRTGRANPATCRATSRAACGGQTDTITSERELPISRPRSTRVSPAASARSRGRRAARPSRYPQHRVPGPGQALRRPRPPSRPDAAARSSSRSCPILTRRCAGAPSPSGSR